jgi:hypothetical protein
VEVRRIDEQVREWRGSVCDVCRLRLSEDLLDQPVYSGGAALSPDIDAGLVRFVVNQKYRTALQHLLASRFKPANKAPDAVWVLLDDG